MADFRNFLFFDLEYNPGTSTVREYGFAFGAEKVRAPGSNPAKLEEAAERAEFLVGHNVLKHDAPILKQYFNIEFPHIKAIDTLMLSSLMFPRKPYHKLRKEYLHNDNEPSDPLKDALLSKQILEDCIEKWNTFPWQLRYLLYLFLKDKPGFAAFFTLLHLPSDQEIRSKRQEVQTWFVERYKTSICLNNFQDEWNDFHIEWSYLLTLFNEEGPSDYVPHWVRYQYPHIERILHRRRMIPCEDKKCPYCSNELDSVHQLEKWFKYPSFRKFTETETIPIQQQVVECALRGESLLAVFPTGGGKSLTFQLPALIAGKQMAALTVVISPIVALMKDQVDVLEKRHQIGDAVYINSMLSPLERKNAIRAVAENEKNILYISPEALRSNTIFKLLKFRRIERFVIDEAHCFSSWGHDFRVDYMYLAEFIKELQVEKKLETPIPVSCFTATAKQDVIDDICGYFKTRLNIDLVKFVSPATRTNLHYDVIEAEQDSKSRNRQLVGLLKEYRGPKIIYASKVKTTEKLAENLHQYGFNSASYNGKMDADVKMKTQDDFQRGDIDTIVATTAFGMGVDKDNVELVAHYEISSTLENYVQEAGRAGRNPNMQAYCVALYNAKDLDTNFQLLQQSKLTEKDISEIWRVLKKQSEGRPKIVMSALEIADKCGWTEQTEDTGVLKTKVSHAVLLLEEQGFLKRNRNQTQFYGSSITVESVEQARQILGIQENDTNIGSTEYTAFRIIRHIITKRWTKTPECAMDDLTVSLGIEQQTANAALRILRSRHLLEEKNDWSAKVQRGGIFNSLSMLERAQKLQDTLLNACEHHDVNEAFALCLTELNARQAEGATGTESRKNLQIMRGILRYWAHESVAEIHLVEAGRQRYQVEFLKTPEEVRSNLQKNWNCFKKTVESLLTLQKDQEKRSGGVVWFSLNKLIEMNYGLKEVESVQRQEQLEFALLFLHLIGSIALDHGLMVFYTGLVLEVNPEARSKTITDEEYKKLKEFYDNKAESIHIVGKYAETMLHNKDAAQELLNDYFTMDIGTFRLKYMIGEEMHEAISSNLRQKIEENVNEEQRKVIKSRNKHILVGAGPGSGKTHMLVHKVASLLWLEEAQPTSLLVLTFTRSACRELRKRIANLAGGLATGVTITTFHALAFSVLGIQGSKKAIEGKNENGEKDNGEGIINKAAEVIESGEDVGLGAPGVILVDEFQDLSAAEYRLLKALYNLGEKSPRVIAVGDDDQSIYEFRGSSSEYFRKFAVEFPNTKEFYLTTNYRSAANLVRANEELLTHLDYRVKFGKKQFPQNAKGGDLNFYEEHDCTKGAFAAAELLVQKIKNVNETACILSPENAESFLAAAKLEELGLAYKIIKGQDREKCPIESTREILGFKKILEADPRVGQKPWTIKEFKNIAVDYMKSHDGESSFELLKNVINDYVDSEQACNNDELTLGSFSQYLSDVTLADLGEDNKATINVGTMHSSKGMEWDHVFLNLGEWKPETQEQFRLLYVASTRAKKSLTIIAAEENMPKNWVKKFDVKKLKTSATLPKILHVETGLSDLNLGHILINDKNKKRVRYIQESLVTLPINSDIDIDYSKEFKSFNTNYNGRLIAAFSQSFHGIIKSLWKNFYTPNSAKIVQICQWHSDDGQDVWVPLLRVEFREKISPNSSF